MVTTSSYSFQVMISNYLLGFLFCSLFKLSHPRPKLQSCIMAANVYTILIQEPGEKAILFMKRMFLFLIHWPLVITTQFSCWFCIQRCMHYGDKFILFFLFFAPGSGAYNIFHPLLFQKSLDVLRLWPCKDVLNCKLYCRDDSCQVECII